jgi:hypothetical protein
MCTCIITWTVIKDSSCNNNVLCQNALKVQVSVFKKIGNVLYAMCQFLSLSDTSCLRKEKRHTLIGRIVNLWLYCARSSGDQDLIRSTYTADLSATHRKWSKKIVVGGGGLRARARDYVPVMRLLCTSFGTSFHNPTLENEATAMPRNLGNRLGLYSDAASYPRRKESSATRLRNLAPRKR